jgi:Fe-S-cluster containining protein
MSDFDCTKCGACCLYPGDDDPDFPDMASEYARVSSYDLQRRLRPASLDGLVNIRKRTKTSKLTMPEFGFMKTKSFGDFGMGCTALRGTPGRRTSCGIYEQRPTVCRKFKPGSDACLEARQEIGMSTGG